MRSALALIGAACSVILGPAATYAQDKPPAPIPPRTFALTVRLQLPAGKALALADVKYSTFPGGKRCAFTYKGAAKAATIQAFTDMGFRTTVHVSPGTSPERLAALENAGAEIAVGSYWGAKGTYSSMIGANTVQEALDAIATSRLAVKKNCRGPVACGSFGGHFDPETFPFNRNVERGAGYGAALSDSNLLQCNEIGQSTPYAIMLGRYRAHPTLRVTMRERFSNIIRARKVPNEKIYYQMLSHQFLGTLNQVVNGQIIQYSLRDFKAKDLRSIKRIMGKYGRHPLIWHATEGMLASYEYLKRKVHVQAVKPVAGSAVEVTLGLEKDIFPPFLLAPLSLELPADSGVTGASVAGLPCEVVEADGKLHVAVPLAEALAGGVTMTLKQAAGDMTVPDEMAVTLTLTNTSRQPLTDARLTWIESPTPEGKPGLTVAAPAAGAFTLAPGQKRTVDATLRTTPEAVFGITPLGAVLTGRLGGQGRLFMAGFEVPVAPMLAVEVSPYNQTSILKGRFQHILVDLSNVRAAGKFLSHKAGPCKGVVSFNPPAGLEVRPAKLPFELAAGEKARLVFRLYCNEWSPQAARVPPIITLAGRKDPVRFPYPGTKIIRDRKVIDHKPLDADGLLACATWDDKNFCGFTTAVGKRGVGHGGLSSKIGVNWTPIADGAKGWCIGAQSAVLADSFKNIDFKAGTIACWIRRDLRIRNENQYRGDPNTSWKRGAVVFANNNGETIWVAGGGGQLIGRCQRGITLRRYYGWDGREGYLEAIWQGMGQLRVAQAPYENKRLLEWRHVAVLWDVEARRLEIYIDGKLAAKAPPGEAEWYGCPWDNGTPSTGGRAHGIQAISMDHGKATWTMRDEFYIYNRPLSPEKIRANMNRAKPSKPAK